MHHKLLRWALPVGLLACAPGWLAPAAQAMPDKKFTLGIGLIGSSIAGGDNGTTPIKIGDPTNGPDLYAGRLKNGGGIYLSGGIRWNPHVGGDLLLLSSAHEAVHDRLPNQTLNARLQTLLVALRVMAPVGETFEIFGRGGVGAYTIAYQQNAKLEPNPTFIDSELAGGGLAFGGGIAVHFEPLAVELSVLRHAARLNRATVGGLDEPISSRLRVTTLTLGVTLHLGERAK
jgi:hypothetical protein